MQANQWSEILGNDIPNMLKQAKELEAKLTPILLQVNQQREGIDPELLKHFDASMEQIKEAKAKWQSK
jgi:hypothetical protein